MASSGTRSHHSPAEGLGAPQRQQPSERAIRHGDSSRAARAMAVTWSPWLPTGGGTRYPKCPEGAEQCSEVTEAWMR